MSADEFWKQDPELFWAYRFSYYERRKFEEKKANHHAWLQGIYFHQALSVSLSNAFGKGGIKYFDKPIDFEEKNDDSKSYQSKIEINLRNRVSAVQELFRSGKCKTN